MGATKQGLYMQKKQYAGQGLPEIHQFRQLEVEHLQNALFFPALRTCELSADAPFLQ
jgi:hypothetical protein